jgi:translation initiation factor eIF-2B subunit delta
MSNGAAVSRAGTAVVAMVAKSHCKPVVLCCESIKISEHVQFDAISENELCDPDVLLALPGGVESPLCEMSKTADSQLKLLNLNYDLTPSNYISMVVTEFGMAPPTSVPAILRECRDAQTINVVDFSKK